MAAKKRPALTGPIRRLEKAIIRAWEQSFVLRNTQIISNTKPLEEYDPDSIITLAAEIIEKLPNMTAPEKKKFDISQLIARVLTDTRMGLRTPALLIAFDPRSGFTVAYGGVKAGFKDNIDPDSFVGLRSYHMPKSLVDSNLVLSLNEVLK